jgi:hypothetical protein
MRSTPRVLDTEEADYRLEGRVYVTAVRL